MLKTKRQGIVTAALVAGLCSSVAATGWGIYQAQSSDVSTRTTDIQAVGQTQTVNAPPAKPQLSAEQAWGMVQPQIDDSPWLSKADETSAWIKDAGEKTQQAAAAVSDNLRELNYLMNDHWAGRKIAHTLKVMASGTATLAPDPATKAVAFGITVVIEYGDSWALLLADQADDLNQWVDSFTEPYERYANAYKAVHENQTPENLEEWVTASQALIPHLEKAQRICSEIEEQLANVSGKLNELHHALEGADHWSVDWLAENVDEKLVVPSVDKLDHFRLQTQAISARATFDQALLTSLPGRFERYDIVD